MSAPAYDGRNGYSARQLAEAGRDHIPDWFSTRKHLIYSSPATLAFNSPGAEGFGVKRAALSIPGSIMLVVAPGCCARNTSGITEIPGYKDRFFYLVMDEADLITARHLKKIPEAVREIYDFCQTKPSLIILLITCVDALLGTDLDRISRQAEEKVPVPVRPAYMYALTREGRKPPMVHVRQSLYSLLPQVKRRADHVNLLGYFSHLTDDCELYDILGDAGVTRIGEISRCKDIEEFYGMGDANFNLVLHPEAREAADDLWQRLGMPYVELTRLFEIDKIAAQYDALGQAIGFKVEKDYGRSAALEAVQQIQKSYPELSFAVGEGGNADPFELALALLRYGFKVPVVYGTPNTERFNWIARIANLSPETRIYTNMSPDMLTYDAGQFPVDVAIGKDACWYHPQAAQVRFNEDIQPYGFAGVKMLFAKIGQALESGKEGQA